MKTVEINVYQYSELSDKAKERAANWWLGCVSVDEWSDFVMEDAKNIGLNITEWDIDHGIIRAKLEDDCEVVTSNILKEHGEMCDTYKAAEAWRVARDKIITEATLDADGEFEDLDAVDNALDAINDELLNTLRECYLSTLKAEYEYYTGEEHIAEAMEANEYTFTADGERFN